MKKVLFGAMIAPLLIVGCSKEPVCSNSYEINLRAKVLNAETKAAPVYGPIYSNFTADFPIGIYAIDGTWKAPANNIINNDQATVLAADKSIAFANGPYFYPASGDNATFFAFAPNGSESTLSSVGNPPQVTFSMTGHEDIMWATGIGNKVGSNPANNPTLNFAHKLTQLQFTFKSGTAYPTSGYKVTSLIIRAQPTTAVMNVATGALSFGGSAGMQALSAATIAAGGVEITGAGTDAQSPVMTNVASNYTMDVAVMPAGNALTVTFANIPIVVSASVGTSHMITLTFNETNVAASATVADWQTGSSGSATVQ